MMYYIIMSRWKLSSSVPTSPEVFLGSDLVFNDNFLLCMNRRKNCKEDLLKATRWRLFCGGTKAAVIRGDVWLIPHENNSSVALQIDHTSPCLRKKLNFVRILTNRKCANISYKDSLLLRKRTCTVLNVNVILLVTHWCSPVANLC